MIWLGMLVLIAIGYIGADYARLLIQCKRLKNFINQNIDSEKEPTRIRFVFIGKKDSSVGRLMDMCENAHARGRVKERVRIGSRDSSLEVFYDNGNELFYYSPGSQIIPFLQEDVEDFDIKVFFDEGLSGEEIKKTIITLGLTNYAATICLCKGDK